MKVYILKSYPNSHKWQADAEVLGYFASVNSLRKAIKENAAELSLYGGKDPFNALKRGQIGTVNSYLETGLIEVVDAAE